MNNFHSQVHKVGAYEAVNCIATFLVIMYHLILTYNIVFGLIDINPEDFFTFANSNQNTRGHTYKLLPSHCRINVRKSFFCRKGS